MGEFASPQARRCSDVPNTESRKLLGLLHYIFGHPQARARASRYKAEVVGAGARGRKPRLIILKF